MVPSPTREEYDQERGWCGGKNIGEPSAMLYSTLFWEPSSRIIKRNLQKIFDEFVEHGPKFLILQSVSCVDPSRRLQMAPGAAQKPWKLGKPQLRRLLEPSRRHVIEMFLEIWALTQVNFLNPEGHKCSHLGRTRPDGSKIWTFTSASRFLLWLGGITHMGYLVHKYRFTMLLLNILF